MQIKELRRKLKNPKLFGVIPSAPKGTFDQTRSVIVQVQTGWRKVFDDDDFEVPVYEYHEIRAVGTLFHGGEFKAVIAVGGDDE